MPHSATSRLTSTRLTHPSNAFPPSLHPQRPGAHGPAGRALAASPGGGTGARTRSAPARTSAPAERAFLPPAGTCPAGGRRRAPEGGGGTFPRYWSESRSPEARGSLTRVQGPRRRGEGPAAPTGARRSPWPRAASPHAPHRLSSPRPCRPARSGRASASCPPRGASRPSPGPAPWLRGEGTAEGTRAAPEYPQPPSARRSVHRALPLAGREGAATVPVPRRRKPAPTPKGFTVGAARGPAADRAPTRGEEGTGRRRVAPLPTAAPLSPGRDRWEKRGA